MSTVRTNTLQNVAGSNRPAVTGGEFVDKRFNLNGTGTIAERDSFGIASYVDHGTGDYTSNFSTAYPNANYTALSGPIGITGGVVFAGNNFLLHVPTTTAFRLAAWRQSDFAGNSSREDGSLLSMAFVGDIP